MLIGLSIETEKF